MTNKELKKLSREGLMELLIESLEENESLKQQLKEAQDALAAVKEDSFSTVHMQEEMQKTMDIFARTQQSSLQYIAEMQAALAQQMEACKLIEAESRSKAVGLLEETERVCRSIEQETLKRCDELKAIAEREAARSWTELVGGLTQMSRSNAELRERLCASLDTRNDSHEE